MLKFFIMLEESEFKPDTHEEEQTISYKFDQEKAAQITHLEQDKLPFSEALIRFQGSLNSYTAAYYDSHGIAGVQFPDHIYRVPKKEGEFGSSTYHGVVQISARGGPETGSAEEEQVLDTNLAEYLEARALAHEVYHATATIELHAKDQMDTLHTTIKRVGIIQTRTLHKEGSPALEEGLAQMFEQEAFGLLKEHFPEGASLHDELVEEVAKENADQLARQQVDKNNLVVISYKDRNNYTVGINGYPDSQRLVSYIEQYVPNLRTLSERARVQGDEKGLEQALDDAFTPETYNYCLHIREEDATKGIELLTVGRRLHDKAIK